MYLYETHLHTAPVSACATATVRESLEYYKSLGYAGVFMTDHFIESNFDRSARDLPYKEKIERYFSAYEEGLVIGKEIGIDVFPGIEASHSWAHFLIYGIDKAWCLAHPEMETMPKRDLLPILKDAGALIIQAHPFRKVNTEITLFPQYVHGTEIFNAAHNDFENRLGAQYCENYGLRPFAGSDNHSGSALEILGGIATERRIKDFEDFKAQVLNGETRPFRRDADGVHLL